MLENLLIFVALCAFAYMAGSIPFGYILTKAFTGLDIRDIGSGNIGATNVLRTGSKMLAIATLCLDMMKAIVPVIFAQVIMIAASPWTGLFAILGHVYPMWLNFKGGKGVASSLGVILVLNFEIGMSMLIIWVAVAFLKRYSSLAAITAFTAAPLMALVMLEWNLLIPLLLISGVVIYRHSDNIERLRAGTEPKINLERKPVT